MHLLTGVMNLDMVGDCHIQMKTIGTEIEVIVWTTRCDLETI